MSKGRRLAAFLLIGMGAVLWCSTLAYASDKKPCLSDVEVDFIYHYENIRVRNLENEITEAVKCLSVAYFDVYGILLPRKIHIIVEDEKSSPSQIYMSSNVSNNSITIIRFFSIKKLELWDMQVLAHELGHHAIGSTEDSDFDESLADFLGLNVRNYLYRKASKKMPTRWYSEKKAKDYYVILNEVQKKYGEKVIGKLIRKIRERFDGEKSRKAVSMNDVKQMLNDLTQNNFFSQEIDKHLQAIFPSIGIVFDALTVDNPGQGIRVKETMRYSNFLGFENGDVIVSLNGVKVSDVYEFKKYWGNIGKTIEPWDEMSIDILRDNKRKTIKFHFPYDSMGASELFERNLTNWETKKIGKLTIVSKEISQPSLSSIENFYAYALEAIKSTLKMNLPEYVVYIVRSPTNSKFRRFFVDCTIRKMYQVLHSEEIELFKTFGKYFETSYPNETVELLHPFYLTIFSSPYGLFALGDPDMFYGFRMYLMQYVIAPFMCEKNKDMCWFRDFLQKEYADDHSHILTKGETTYSMQKARMAQEFFKNANEKFGGELIGGVISELIKKNGMDIAYPENVDCKSVKNPWIDLKDVKEAFLRVTNQDSYVKDFFDKYETVPVTQN